MTDIARFGYAAYGLCICSDFRLPELASRTCVPDVFVRRGNAGYQVPTSAVHSGNVWATARVASLFYEGVGVFLVRDGREIVVEPTRGADEATIRLFILGPALGVLLHQRGSFVAHASAMEIDGLGIAILGAPRSGKSTLAAALYARGHAAVADDVTAVRLTDDVPMVSPGFPQLKLWPEAAAYFGDDPGSLPRIRPMLEKRARRLSSGFQTTPLPLTHVYVLGEGPLPEVTPVRPQDAFIDLVRHSYCAKLVPGTGKSSHFLQCGALAEKVKARHVRHPRLLPTVSELARLIEDDVRGGA